MVLTEPVRVVGGGSPAPVTQPRTWTSPFLVAALHLSFHPALTPSRGTSQAWERMGGGDDAPPEPSHTMYLLCMIVVGKHFSYFSFLFTDTHV